MYKIPANTLFTGKNLVFVPECPSTNTLALEITHQSAVKEGTVVITDTQTAGKGQRGNIWEARPGLNLTFSLIMKPAFLPVNKQFYLNIVTSLGLRDYLKMKTSDTIYIKWPNDILVHEKKISGILIENQLQGSAISCSVIGIGLNLNQKEFGSPTATSLALVAGRDFDRHLEVEQILECLERRYLQLRAGGYDSLMEEYLGVLYRRNIRSRFAAGDHMFEGIIRDLDEWGKLRVESNDGIKSYGIKEIQYVQ